MFASYICILLLHAVSRVGIQWRSEGGGGGGGGGGALCLISCSKIQLQLYENYFINSRPMHGLAVSNQ